MRRPFQLSGARLLGRRTGQPLSDRFQLRFQRLNFAVLAEYHIADLGDGLLEIGNF